MTALLTSFFCWRKGPAFGDLKLDLLGYTLGSFIFGCVFIILLCWKFKLQGAHSQFGNRVSSLMSFIIFNQAV